MRHRYGIFMPGWKIVNLLLWKRGKPHMDGQRRRKGTIQSCMLIQRFWKRSTKRPLKKRFMALSKSRKLKTPFKYAALRLA